MATYTIIAHMRLDGYAVVQTLTDNEIQPGQSITIANCGHGLNGTHTVLFCPQYEYIGTEGATGQWLYNTTNPRANQLLFEDEGADLEWDVEPHGTVTWTPTCTWITASDIETYVGITVATAGETTYLTQCAAAANAFCSRRRWEAGYLEDSLTTSPSGDVTLGTIMYGAALYRQRGSIDQFASFDAMSTAQIVGLAPIVKQLLGIDRPQVA
jgi:hypothetical protein